jgi:hypothetical protein
LLVRAFPHEPLVQCCGRRVGLSYLIYRYLNEFSCRGSLLSNQTRRRASYHGLRGRGVYGRRTNHDDRQGAGDCPTGSTHEHEPPVRLIWRVPRTAQPPEGTRSVSPDTKRTVATQRQCHRSTRATFSVRILPRPDVVQQQTFALSPERSRATTNSTESATTCRDPADLAAG